MNSNQSNVEYYCASFATGCVLMKKLGYLFTNLKLNERGNERKEKIKI